METLIMIGLTLLAVGAILQFVFGLVAILLYIFNPAFRAKVDSKRKK